MKKLTTAKRLENAEKTIQRLEDLVLNHSVHLHSLRSALSDSPPLLQVDPELPNRIHRHLQQAVDQLLENAGSQQNADRLKKLFADQNH